MKICPTVQVLDFELLLCDTQPSQLWGPRREFLSGPRLDNEVHCFTAVEALCASGPLASDVRDRRCSLFCRKDSFFGDLWSPKSESSFDTRARA